MAIEPRFNLPNYKITKGPEQWTNGYMVWEFEVWGVPFKLMQRICKTPEEAEYTSLHVEEWGSEGYVPRALAENAPWLEKYPPNFPGTITVEGMIQIMCFAKIHHQAGAERGKVAKALEIRKALNL